MQKITQINLPFPLMQILKKIDDNDTVEVIILSYLMGQSVNEIIRQFEEMNEESLGDVTEDRVSISSILGE